MAGYENFSTVYDALMADINYPEQAKRLLRLFERYDRRPTLLLDLACGTGNFSAPLAAEGVEVIGVDCSPGMLAVAQSKRQNPQNPLFLCQRAEELDLFGTVDGAICMLDSLNHLTSYAGFAKALKRTALFLEPGRLFIFDLNTPYKHQKILNNNTFVRQVDGAFCVWQNARQGNTVEVLLDLFVKQPGTNLFARRTEEFSERAYTPREVERALQAAGLTPVAVLDETGAAPHKNSERLVYITKKDH